ncbi:MAG: rod shape-determining protein MreD [Planctomycetaceae bacterium]
MKHFYLAALLYLAAVLQMGNFLNIAGWFANPAWVWLVLIAAVRHVERPAVMVWGAVIGLCADCVSAGPLGLQLICGVILAGWLSTSASDLSRSRPFYVAFLAGIAVLLASMIVLSWTVLSGAQMMSRDELSSFFAPASSTALAAFILELCRGGWFWLIRLSPRTSYAGYAAR